MVYYQYCFSSQMEIIIGKINVSLFNQFQSSVVFYIETSDFIWIAQIKWVSVIGVQIKWLVSI